MGRFSDYLKNFGHQAKAAHDSVGGVKGAAEKARSYGSEVVGDYRKVHHNMPGASEYLQSDAGKATARFAMGSSLQGYLQTKAKKLGKGGTVTGAVGSALFTFASTAFQSHMNNLKHDQRIFENVAKARRGSPELEHLTHLELREIADNAKRYGGPDAEHISKTASGELDRRQTKKNVEQAKGIEQKRGMLHASAQAREASKHETAKGRKQEMHEQKRAQKEELHKDKMRRQAELRNTAGHVGAKDTTDNVAKAAAAAKAPAAGADVKKGGSDKGKVRVKGKTKSGNLKVENEKGKTEYLDPDQVKSRNQGGTTRKKGPTTGRERAPGAGRSSRGRGR